MYESHYGFRERPFSLLPDPMFLFASRHHNAALAALTYAFETNAAICVLSGAPGTGKTTLLRELMRRLPPGVRVGLLSNSHPSITELLHWILSAFAIPCEGDSRRERADAFRDFLLSERSKGRRVLVMLDEAQNLTPAALEELRLLANLSTADGPSLQLILAGQPALTALLATSELAPFTQRIVLNEKLEALDAEETVEYIKHRVRLAGAAGDVFERAACDAVFRHAGGNPRLINLLCDLCLVHGAIQGAPVITRGIVEAVLRDRALRSALPEFQTLDSLPVQPVSENVADDEASPRKLLRPKRKHPQPSQPGLAATSSPAAMPEPAASTPVPSPTAGNVAVTSSVLTETASRRDITKAPDKNTGAPLPAGWVEMNITTQSKEDNVVTLHRARNPDDTSPRRSLAGPFAAGLAVAVLIAGAVILGTGKHDDANTDTGKVAGKVAGTATGPAAITPAVNPELIAAEASRLQREIDKAIATTRDLERERDAAIAAQREAIKSRDALQATIKRARQTARTVKPETAPETASKPATDIAPVLMKPLPIAKPALTAPTANSAPLPLPSENAVTIPETPSTDPDARASTKPAPASLPDQATTPAPAKEPSPTAQESRGFSANPCKGPSARFLSTCKN